MFCLTQKRYKSQRTRLENIFFLFFFFGIIMSVEAEITRQLGITFIDARALGSEAKILEGVEGYATRAQIPQLVARATELFYAKSESEQMEWKQRNEDLESAKSSQHSRHRRDGDDNSSIQSVESNASLSSNHRNNSGVFRKVVSLSAMRRKNAVVAQTPMRNAAFGASNATFGKAQPMQPKENPLLKRVTSTGGITKNSMKSTRVAASKNFGKKNAMSRIDHLGGILDIQIPNRKSQPLEAIPSGRDWGEA